MRIPACIRIYDVCVCIYNQLFTNAYMSVTTRHIMQVYVYICTCTCTYLLSYSPTPAWVSPRDTLWKCMYTYVHVLVHIYLVTHQRPHECHHETHFQAYIYIHVHICLATHQRLHGFDHILCNVFPAVKWGGRVLHLLATRHLHRHV
jgi:hypothetical protein